jgi:hypothetical protein
MATYVKFEESLVPRWARKFWRRPVVDRLLFSDVYSTNFPRFVQS